MNEVVDLYSKRLIGTFSFIGPSFSLLIPIFYPAFVHSRQRHTVMYNNLSRVYDAPGGLDMFADAEKNNKKLKRMISGNQKDIHLLNPKRQIKRLFMWLLSAIALVMFYHFQKSVFWPHQYQLIWITTLMLSMLNFALSLFVLWQIFCIVIRIKQEEKSKFLIKLETIDYGRF
ncbi:MAG: hypothetical protein JNL59_05060 [Chitinophagaceae bacterium]|nr:hypothetical protein [Chitinophagaceae bacterium]